MKKAVFFLFALALIYGCSENLDKFTGFKPPIEKLNPAYTSFSINAEEGGSFKMPSGTTITVPPNVLADESGKTVKGQVEFKFREFYDALGAMLAGVSLDYDSAGVVQPFRTAGMFEIQASQGNNKINIAPDKAINVKMASYKKGNEFNFYTYDQEKMNWQYKGTDTAEVNYQKVALEQEYQEVKEQANYAFGQDYFAFNYNAIVDIYFNDDYYKITENFKSAKPRQKAKEYGLTCLSIHTKEARITNYGVVAEDGIENFQTIKFKGNNFLVFEMVWKNLTDKKIPKLGSRSSLKSLKKIEGENRFELTVTKGKDIYKAEIEAVMPIKFLFQYSPDYWASNFDQAMKDAADKEDKFRKELRERLERERKEREKELAEMRKRIELQADVFRSFNITTMGMHNWDVLYKAPDFVIAKGNVKCNNPKYKTDDRMLYYFINNGESCVYVSPSQRDKLRLIPDSTAKIMIIFDDATVGIFDAKQYQKINFGALKSQTEPSVNFDFVHQQSPVSEAALRKDLGASSFFSEI